MHIIAVLLVSFVAACGALEFIDINEYNKSAKVYESTHHHDSSKSGVKLLDLGESSHKTSSAVMESPKLEVNPVKTAEDANVTKAVIAHGNSKGSDASGNVEFLTLHVTNTSTVETPSLNSKVVPSLQAEQPRAKGEFLATEQKEPSTAQNAPAKVVLVTGITGMIGSVVAEELVRQHSFKVVGLVREDSSLQRIASVQSSITLTYGDITDALHMIDVLAQVKPDVVLHFAAQSSNALSFDNPQHTMNVNVQGTLNVLEAVRRNGLFNTTVFIAGSWSEYGRSVETVGNSFIPETLALDPVSPFGLSKASAEQLSLQYYRNYNIPVIVGRFFFVLGRGTSAMSDVQGFCRSLVQIESQPAMPPIIKHHSNVRMQRDIVHVSDAANAVVRLVESGRAGEAYNIGSGEGTTTQTILLALASSSPRAASLKVEYDSNAKSYHHDNLVVADTSKLRKATGWKPLLTSEKAVADEMQYWRASVKSN